MELPVRPPGPRTLWVLSLLPTVLLALFLGMLVALDVIPTRAQPVAVGESVAVQAQVLARTETLIADHYYLPTENREELFHDAMWYLVDQLRDRYSYYLDPDASNKAQDDTSGRFVGLGVSIEGETVPIRVLTALPNSPALRAGIRPGDQIIAVDGEDISSLPFDDAKRRLSGEEGSHVTLSLLRRDASGQEVPVEVAFDRQNVANPSVVNAVMLGVPLPADRAFAQHRLDNAALARNAGIGYMRILKFTTRTADEFHEAMAQLQEAGMRSLILDLRGNPGGIMNACETIAGAFLPEGTLIVFTAGRNPIYNQRDVTTTPAEYPNLPLVVLVDERSASASEILAGCLQDHRRALILGENTFGKGLVQTRFNLPDNASSLRLTIARYFTPSGRCLQHDETTGFRGGVEPDLTLPVSDQEALALGYLHRDQLVIGGQPWHAPDVADLLAETFTDGRLDTAIAMLAGQPVAGQTMPTDAATTGH